MIAIELPEEIETRLSSLAEATGRPVSFYVREALLEHLDDLEDVYLAERELRAVEEGHSRVVPLADIMKQYGLAD
jgi:RHH-type rel operon transcriptional repressor/antitoxin RelB